MQKGTISNIDLRNGYKEYREKLISHLDKHEDIISLEDGFRYLWIPDRGALSANDLRMIADELDDRNQDWQKQITDYFNANVTDEAPPR